MPVVMERASALFLSATQRSNEISKDISPGVTSSLIAEDGVDLRRISEISGAISELIN
jgi:hypothetical protein